MATAWKLLDKILLNALAVQHLTFTFQSWISPSVLKLAYETEKSDNDSVVGILTVWLCLIACYTIAAKVTIGSLIQAILVKFSLIAVCGGLAILLYSGLPIVAGLILEATINGIFECTTFNWYLSLSLDARQRPIRLGLLLLAIIVGYALIPRALGLLGLPTHTTIGATPEVALHVTALFIHALISEGLILACPSTFARLSSRSVPGTGRIYTKSPTATSNVDDPSDSSATYKITAMHQMLAWWIVTFVWGFLKDTTSFILRPASVINGVICAHKTVGQIYKRVSQVLCLALLGRPAMLRELLAETWTLEGVGAALHNLSDVMQVIFIWTCCILALLTIYSYFRTTKQKHAKAAIITDSAMEEKAGK